MFTCCKTVSEGKVISQRLCAEQTADENEVIGLLTCRFWERFPVQVIAGVFLPTEVLTIESKTT